MAKYTSRMNLKTRAFIMITIPLMVVIGTATLITTYGLVPRLEQALVDKTINIGENLVQEINDTIDLGISLTDLTGLSKKLTELTRQHQDLGYIYITDEKGEILYRTEDMPSGADALAGAARWAAGKPDFGTTTEKIKASGDSYYNIFTPVKSEGTLVGVVHLGMERSIVKSIFLRSLIVGAISFFLATALIILFVNRLISRPLEELSETARTISSGNLVPPKEMDRHDEIGQLAESFRAMVGNLASIIGRSRETSDSVETSAGDLTKVARGLSNAFQQQLSSMDQVVESMEEMDKLSHVLSRQAKSLSDSAADSSASIVETGTAIGEINRNMADITTAVEAISSSILEMSTTGRQVAAGAEQTANMAEETKEVIARINTGIQNIEDLAEKSSKLADSLKLNASDIGAQAMKESLQGIHSIQDDVKHSETAMKALQDKVGSISGIITVIEEIAEQTNLLALNASIISAQAGEHGRSFAIVASEIRELSVRTSDSTKKISSLIQAVQEESSNYADYQTRVSQSVDKGLSLGEEAEKALSKIVESADESSQMASHIVQVTKEQSEASEQVSNSVKVFARSAEEIKKATSDEAKGTEFIKEAMEKAKGMIDMVFKATAEQDRGSQMIAETSEKAKHIAEELSSATEKERGLSQEISMALESLKKTSHANSELVKKINTSSELMTDLSSALKKELAMFKVSGMVEKNSPAEDEETA